MLAKGGFLTDGSCVLVIFGYSKSEPKNMSWSELIVWIGNFNVTASSK